MWQLICLCLPTMTKQERQRLLALFGSVVHEQGRELGTPDFGLAFLYSLTAVEALTVLEERRELVARSREWLATQEYSSSDGKEELLHLLVHDHIHTLLEAEDAWLERAIGSLRLATAQ